jgi:hypothetical protein
MQELTLALSTFTQDAKLYWKAYVFRHESVSFTEFVILEYTEGMDKLVFLKRLFKLIFREIITKMGMKPNGYVISLIQPYDPSFTIPPELYQCIRDQKILNMHEDLVVTSDVFCKAPLEASVAVKPLEKKRAFRPRQATTTTAPAAAPAVPAVPRSGARALWLAGKMS